MPESKPIPVRLPDALVQRLDATALTMGTTRSALIRLCAEAFVQHFDKNAGVTFPVDWEQVLPVVQINKT